LKTTSLFTYNEHVLQKVIEVRADSIEGLSIRVGLIHKVIGLGKKIKRIKNKLKKEFHTVDEETAAKKEIKTLKHDYLSILEKLAIPDFIFRVPATKKMSKELEREEPQVYEKKTKKNVQKNIQ